jgi:hypothetical protein
MKDYLGADKIMLTKPETQKKNLFFLLAQNGYKNVIQIIHNM